ncbi:Gfo/Idh/MocA family protein [Oleiharenicola lentus]|uniref:Gfo/Idh/MocA family protein n=1 Tax=Oleiharenicola lentus TaxID=2508720 RepID=UPI003F662A08
MIPLPIVLVGCGAVSQHFYAPALRALEATGVLRMHALVDPAASSLAALHAIFPHATTADNLSGVTAPRDSLAIIASPPVWHATQTIAAFSKGWHVLCEKPMAATTIEADGMIHAALAAGRILAVGHYKRFFPSSQLLKFFCTPGGPLGELCSFRVIEGGPFSWPAASPGFFKRSETPGGVLFDLGIHGLDLLLWLLGSPDHFTYADDAMGGLEANAHVSLQFGKITGSMQLSRDWKTAQRYEFEFQRGTFSWTVNDANGVELTFRDAPFAMRSTLHDLTGRTAATNAQSFIAQLQHVLAAIRNGSPVLVDGYAGKRALALVEACYARRTPLAQPWLTAPEQAHPQLQRTLS